jgi:hypothetical protein
MLKTTTTRIVIFTKTSYFKVTGIIVAACSDFKYLGLSLIHHQKHLVFVVIYRIQKGPDPPSLLCNGHPLSFLGVKRLGRGIDHPPPSSAEVKERVELYLCSPSGPSWPVLG